MTLNININTHEGEPQKIQEVVDDLVDECNQVQTTTGSPYWIQAKLRYFEENMREGAVEAYTLKQLAEDMNLNYGSLRQISWQEGWNKELDGMRAKKADLLMGKILQMQVLSEMDIRLRQAHVARVAQAKALEHLQAIDPKKMKTSDAIALLGLGMTEERKALGMANVANETVQDKEKKQAALNKKSAMDEAMKIIKGIQPTEVKDVN